MTETASRRTGRNTRRPTGAPDTRDTPGGRGAALRGRPWLTAITLSLAAMMVSLDSTIVAVAQPVMQARLGASLAEMQWVTNGYLLAVAVLLIVAGRMGDLFGHRRVFVVGTVGFTLASAAIGFSQGIGSVIAFRVLQGVFGALMQPATLALIMKAFPEERINAALAARSSVIAVSMALGPIAGGLIVHYASWQLAFLINVPLGALTLLLAFLVLREVREAGAARSWDLPGVGLLSTALCALIWGLTAVSDAGWTDSGVLVPLGLALASGGCFVAWERRAPHPVVPMELFRSRLLSVGVLLLVVNAFSLFGATFFLSFSLQHVRGLTAVESGLQVLPLTVTMVLGAPFAAMAISRVGPRIPAALGMLVNAVALYGISRAGADGGGALGVWLFVMGLGFSPIMVGATKLVMHSAPEGSSGVAGGIQQTAMQVGGSLGTAALGALMGSCVRDVLSRDGHWSGAALDRAVQSVSVGLPAPGGPASVARTAFEAGMSTALTVTALVALCAGALALTAGRGAGRKA
ncbi:DHA2 family efflux MFS transporter permease subunit [Streptomyces sp. NPDC044571]|uniref:DHA2 family efflux MFS transporter permease subunit n=1 Tax=Streptomyces sp. NPDC044571 TaxID=3155371 RepID=UPI00340D8CB8